MCTPLKFTSKFFQKSSQVFIDPSCNLLETDEIVPKEVIEHYMANMSLKDQKKYKKLDFYRIQNKFRNFIPLTDEDIFQLNHFDHDEKDILLKIANKAIASLVTYSNF